VHVLLHPSAQACAPGTPPSNDAGRLRGDHGGELGAIHAPATDDGGYATKRLRPLYGTERLEKANKRLQPKALGGIVSAPLKLGCGGDASIVSERRLEAVVVGPGGPGLLRIALGRGSHQYVRDVPADGIPPSLRLPNSCFVAVVVGSDLARVETAGGEWIEIQDQIRSVLNAAWDPIGVAADVDDEYDGYIAGIYSLLQSGASEEALAQHLKSIEVVQMEYGGSSMNKLLAVAAALQKLQLPQLPAPGCT